MSNRRPVPDNWTKVGCQVGNLAVFIRCWYDVSNYWATVNIWYIVPSHQFLKSVLSFFRFWMVLAYISKCFSKPQLSFPKIKMSRILLLNFGCSSTWNFIDPASTLGRLCIAQPVPLQVLIPEDRNPEKLREPRDDTENIHQEMTWAGRPRRKPPRQATDLNIHW